MKELLRLVALTMLGICVVAGGRANAQVFQNGSYYANPSWDQQLPASTRFVVLTNWSNEAVLDRETGLVWQRAPTSFITDWTGAFTVCRERFFGGRAGWRLPTQEELATLLDPTQSNPPLPAGHPFQGIAAGDIFWTASTSEDLSSAAYFVLFSTPATAGFSFVDNKAGPSYRVWCVRGGSGAQNPQ